mgnify:CR=1 FL=1
MEEYDVDIKFHFIKLDNGQIILTSDVDDDFEYLEDDEILVFLHYPPRYKGYECGEILELLEKYEVRRCFYGHLHGGIFEKTFEVLNEKNNVVSLSVPGYRKENNFGINDCGTGYYGEVYDDRVVFTARKFISGEYVKGENTVFEIKLI